MTAPITNSKRTQLLCLAGLLAIAGCATQHPAPVTSEVITTNSFVNLPEWAGLEDSVENLIRAALANNCTAKVILTKVDGNCASVRVIEINPIGNTP
jgi:hypothetical protein